MFKKLRRLLAEPNDPDDLRRKADEEPDPLYAEFLRELADKNYRPRINEYYIHLYKEDKI